MVRQTLTRAVASILLSFQLAGCYVWHDVQAARPDQYVADHRPGHVRLTLMRVREAGTEVPPPVRVELLHPTTAGDSIRGPRALRFAGDPAHVQPGEIVCVARADVARVEVRRLEPVRTTLALAALAWGMAAVVSLATWEGPMGASR